MGGLARPAVDHLVALDHEVVDHAVPVREAGPEGADQRLEPGGQVRREQLIEDIDVALVPCLLEVAGDQFLALFALRHRSPLSRVPPWTLAPAWAVPPRRGGRRPRAVDLRSQSENDTQADGERSAPHRRSMAPARSGSGSM